MKIIFVCTFFATISLQVFSQYVQDTEHFKKFKHEFSFAWGGPSVKKINTDETFVGSFAYALTLGFAPYTEASSNGVFTFSYNYITSSQKFSFGVRYAHEKLRLLYNPSLWPSQQAESTTWSINAFMGNFTFYYLIKSGFRMYSGASVGFSSIHDSNLNETETSGAYQIAVAGITIGKGVGGNMELGYGYEGIFKAGIFCRLK